MYNDSANTAINRYIYYFRVSCFIKNVIAFMQNLNLPSTFQY